MVASGVVLCWTPLCVRNDLECQYVAVLEADIDVECDVNFGLRERQERERDKEGRQACRARSKLIGRG